MPRISAGPVPRSTLLGCFCICLSDRLGRCFLYRNRSPMRITLAALLVAAALPAQAATLRKFDALVIAPKGDVIAAVESGDEPLAHGAIVVRNVADGRIVRTIDPCAKCAY